MSIQAAPLIGQALPSVLAVDNGGTNTRLSLRHGDETLNNLWYPTPHDYDTAIETLASSADLLTDGHPIDAIGFAIAAEVKGTKLVRGGELADYGWLEGDFGSDVAQAFRISTGKIALMNDCVAAAKAQQTVNSRTRGPIAGYVETISTGVGGAGFDGTMLIPDEPGHEWLYSGALCGCGNDGCVEAHISGSGIEKKYGVAAEYLEPAQWQAVGRDAVIAHQAMLERLVSNGFEPEAFYFFGSVALKSPTLLRHIREGFESIELPYCPQVMFATHGDNSGLVGAGDAAVELA